MSENWNWTRWSVHYKMDYVSQRTVKQVLHIPYFLPNLFPWQRMSHLLHPLTPNTSLLLWKKFLSSSSTNIYRRFEMPLQEQDSLLENQLRPIYGARSRWCLDLLWPIILKKAARVMINKMSGPLPSRWSSRICSLLSVLVSPWELGPQHDTSRRNL